MVSEASSFDRHAIGEETARTVTAVPVRAGAAALRLYGFLLAAPAVLIHELLVSGGGLRRAILGASVAAAYGAATWALDRKFPRRAARADAASLNVLTDVALLSWLVYLTGASQSWLWFALALPTCVAAIGVPERALLLAHFTTVAYGAVLFIPQHADWSAGWKSGAGKLLILYCGNLFLVAAARRAALLRERTLSAIRTARERMHEMENNARALAAAKDRSEGVSQAKTDLLAIVSHDIRTPLNGILGMSALTLGSHLDEEQRRCVESIRSSAEWLLHTVDGILDLSQIEARKFELSPAHFDLFERIREIVKPHGIAANDKGIELSCSFGPDVPRNVIADDARIRQVLDNLVGNAIKFTIEGEVALLVSVESRTLHDALLHFVVSDTGPGVSPDAAAKIFEPYVQLPGAPSQGRQRGVGLGLNIASELARLMGGEIWPENREGRGMSFHFTTRVWLQRMITPEERPQVPEGMAKNALVVDDPSEARSALVGTLERWGFDVIASSPVLGSDAAVAVQPESFAVVLIDSVLANADAFAVAEGLLALPSHPPVIMLLQTVGDFEGAARCRSLGAGQVTKPVLPGELATAIGHALTGGPASEIYPLRSGKSFPSHERSLNVLVVEDDSVSQAVAAGLLQAWGHTVRVVPDGTTAVQIADKGEVDLILMDDELSDGRGCEAAAEIRRRERGGMRRAAIIGLTGHATAAAKNAALQAGMDVCLSKPIDEVELFDAVERATGMRPHQVPENREVGDVLATTGGNVPLARKITSLFIEEVPTVLAAMDECLAASDCERLSHLAHKLKGTVANFGSLDTMTAAEELERSASEGRLEDAQALFASLRLRILRLERALRPLVDPGYERSQMPPA